MSASFKDAENKLQQRLITRTHRDLFKENTKLSDREREICHHVAIGASNKEVGEELFITEKTVKFHLTNIYKKLNIKSRSQLIVLVSKYRMGEPMIVAGAAL